jgi:ATPase subunit of ABC transporter with duplicated ATPase domains
MITTENLALSFGKRTLFENVSVKLTPGNCYGLIGANGAGKSTFLKILAGEIEPTAGGVHVPKGLRVSVLRQNHFEFDEVSALDTVIIGHRHLFEVMRAKDALYAKPDFNDEDGMRVSELESEFTDLGGWDAETNAAQLLSSLGLSVEQQGRRMKELSGSEKVRVLLAQALFGDPEILLMDEPTNHLDVDSILWLENFLAEFKNTVVVVSHDRHFLNNVCTHIADIDFQRVQLYTGNYAFWRESSELALKQAHDKNKKTADKIKELQEFVRRFSANASKSAQATSRKKILEKLDLTEIKPSSRKYPHIVFRDTRELGKDVLTVAGLAKAQETPLFGNVSVNIGRGEKVAIVGDDPSVSMLLRTLAGEEKPDKGEVRWGQSVAIGYLPSDNASYFNSQLNLIDWLRQYSPEDQSEYFIRTYLGRMLFSGEESLKPVSVLSGGERVRCLLAKMMLLRPNVLILDQPTNHLDLESITALNEGLVDFPGTLIFGSHDVQFAQTLATRVVVVTPKEFTDLPMTYDEYLARKAVPHS